MSKTFRPLNIFVPATLYHSNIHTLSTAMKNFIHNCAYETFLTTKISRTTVYSATQQEGRFFSRVACRLVFFHSSQKTPKRHTKTFCLASVAIVQKAAYKYVCIDDVH